MMTSFRDKGDNFDQQTGEDRVGTVMLFSVPIVCLYIDNKERLCLAQISNTILRDFSYNEIHNRRVALGITCMQCSPSQLEILRRTGAMPVSSRRCGLITKREAERLVKSFIEDIPPPRLPEDFAFKVSHQCGWGCKGLFIPSRYNSSRAKCIKCLSCDSYFSPNKFIFHYHKLLGGEYKHPDAANFNSWRRHLFLADDNPSESLAHAWEDVKAMFNGGCRKRFSNGRSSSFTKSESETPETIYPRGVGVQYGMPKYPFFSPDRNHSVFSNSMFPRTTSYGDYLRSLSLPYSNPWPNKIDMPALPSHIPKPEFGLPSPAFLPLNIPFPPSRGPWSDSQLMSSPIAPLPIHASSQPCFPEKEEMTARRKRSEASSEDEETKESKDSPSKKARTCTPEPDSSNDVDKDGNDVTEDDAISDSEGKTGLADDGDNITIAESSEQEPTSDVNTTFSSHLIDDLLDENTDITSLCSLPIETLRSAVSKAVQQRRSAEKDHKKIENMLRLRAIKELELREEFAQKFSSIKENLWNEIEQERSAKGVLEEKLKETHQLLQRLSRNIPDPLFQSPCK